MNKENLKKLNDLQKEQLSFNAFKQELEEIGLKEQGTNLIELEAANKHKLEVYGKSSWIRDLRLGMYQLRLVEEENSEGHRIQKSVADMNIYVSPSSLEIGIDIEIVSIRFIDAKLHIIDGGDMNDIRFLEFPDGTILHDGELYDGFEFTGYDMNLTSEDGAVYPKVKFINKTNNANEFDEDACSRNLDFDFESDTCRECKFYDMCESIEDEILLDENSEHSEEI
jgi:hypothetical protein